MSHLVGLDFITLPHILLLLIWKMPFRRNVKFIFRKMIKILAHFLPLVTNTHTKSKEHKGQKIYSF
jgi:hypothetical protein